MSRPFDAPANLRAVPMTIYTERLIVRGTLQTTQHRLTDILNQAAEPFLVLEDVTLEDHGSTDPPIRAEFARVNLASVLFAVSITSVESPVELRTPKMSRHALLSVPPFRIVGDIHLPPGRDLRGGLGELHAAFIPVTDAAFWIGPVRNVGGAVAFVAVNHARAQVFAPFHEAEPPADLPHLPTGPPVEPRPAG